MAIFLVLRPELRRVACGALIGVLEHAVKALARNVPKDP